ncbi:MAG: DUF1697 domain-containing protein [Bacteroidia bacterium]
MKQYVALLRGINVGGHRKIKMAELRSMCEEIGLSEVQTYIQSGNIIFCSPLENAETIATKIKDAILATFGHDVITFVIDKEAYERVIVDNPFEEREDPDPKKLHVCFLYEAVDASLETELQAVESKRDQVALRPKALYLYCPDGFGRTKYTDSVIKRILKTSGTTRNWRSVLKLQEMLQ